VRFVVWHRPEAFLKLLELGEDFSVVSGAVVKVRLADRQVRACLPPNRNRLKQKDARLDLRYPEQTIRPVWFLAEDLAEVIPQIALLARLVPKLQVAAGIVDPAQRRGHGVAGPKYDGHINALPLLDLL
jgi:hypothetical protein